MSASCYAKIVLHSQLSQEDGGCKDAMVLFMLSRVRPMP